MLPITESSTAPTTINVNGSTVAVSAAGNSNAATSNITYTFAAGDYAYSIAGFGTGDVLDFPAGNTPSVNNSSYTDGAVTLAWANNGTTVSVTLTGLAPATDQMLNSSTDFSAAFGAGAVI